VNRPLSYGSVCSGAGTCAMALHPLGWGTAWFSEIEPAPSALLTHRWPSVPNLGDMTMLPERIRSGEVAAPDLLVGGTPCQSFSLAGQRESLNDARGNLTLTFCEIADAIDSRRLSGDGCWMLWENVPGVLGTPDNAFGCLLARLVGAGQELRHPERRWPDAGVVDGPLRSVCWRVFDAQHFGLAQRRRRVFALVGPRGAAVHPAEVLLEPEGVPGDPASCCESREGAAAASRARAARRRRSGVVAPDLARCVTAGEGSRQDWETTTLVAQPLPSLTFDFAASARFHMQIDEELAGTLLKGKQQGVAQDDGPSRPMAVRRLTPRECERLMGWPDDHTLVPIGGKPIAEMHRYRLCGNGWALPCVRWIAARLTATLTRS
jgi:DNA (cytosine-5)-methyltransferase 1